MDKTPRRRVTRFEMTADTAPEPGAFTWLGDWPHRIERVRHLGANRYAVTASRRAGR